MKLILTQNKKKTEIQNRKTIKQLKEKKILLKATIRQVRPLKRKKKIVSDIFNILRQSTDVT